MNTEEIFHNLEQRKISSTEAARLLNVSLPHLSRTLAASNFKKIPATVAATRAKNSEAYKDRQTQRTHLAQQVKSKQLKIAEAAKLAGCSIRTLFRYVKNA